MKITEKVFSEVILNQIHTFESKVETVSWGLRFLCFHSCYVSTITCHEFTKLHHNHYHEPVNNKQAVVHILLCFIQL